MSTGVDHRIAASPVTVLPESGPGRWALGAVGGLAAFAMVARRDRAILLVIPVFAGLFVLGVVAGEVALPH